MSGLKLKVGDIFKHPQSYNLYVVISIEHPEWDTGYQTASLERDSKKYYTSYTSEVEIIGSSITKLEKLIYGVSDESK